MSDAHITPEDLIRQESRLKESLQEVFPHSSGFIYFPKTIPKILLNDQGCYQTAYVRAEKKLLLPLANQHRLLGIYLAKGVDLQQPEITCSFLEQYAKIFLDNLGLLKKQALDPESGVLHRHYLLQQIMQEIEMIQQSNQPQETATDDNNPSYRSTFGLILFYIYDLRSLLLNYGRHFAQRILQEVTRTITNCINQRQLLGRAGENSFALILPQSTPQLNKSSAQKILNELKGLQLEYTVTEEWISPGISCGCSNYPQDLAGSSLQQPSSEQAGLLLHNAFLAARRSSQLSLPSEIMGFAEILTHGGTITNNLALRRVSINLGKLHQAREGQRFLVTAPEVKSIDPKKEERQQTKAELILTRVDWEHAEGEILHLLDPGQFPEPGDRLLHQPKKQDQADTDSFLEHQHPDLQPQKKLMDLRSFLNSWQIARINANHFCLALCKSQALERSELITEIFEAVQHKADQLQESNPGYPTVLLGQYSNNCWLIYMPHMSSHNCLDLLHYLQEIIQSKGFNKPAMGAAFYPCLDMPKGCILDNVRKTLEHALLLQHPQLVCFNSTTLTISADRAFNQHNLSTALEEYKLALILDETNNLARNSLGICYARLGFFDLAGQQFAKILEMEPDNYRALYNFGYTSWKLGDIELAESCFESCLQKTPEKNFCLLRLGQIAEQKGQPEKARQMYYQTSLCPSGRIFAFRFLGRLALQENRPEEAREHLHQALACNPDDAAAMYHLAQLYLQQDEDPEIAEMLLGKSVALRPDQPDYAGLLAQVLANQGKEYQLQQLKTRINFLPDN